MYDIACRLQKFFKLVLYRHNTSDATPGQWVWRKKHEHDYEDLQLAVKELNKRVLTNKTEQQVAGTAADVVLLAFVIAEKYSDAHENK